MLELFFLYAVVAYYHHWWALYVCVTLNVVTVFINLATKGTWHGKDKGEL